MNLLTPNALSALTAKHLIADIKPCLAWCNEYLFDIPNEDDWGCLFRSESLNNAARQVLPESCHTKFSETTTSSFARFCKLRAALLESDRSTHVIDDTIASEEIHRPQSLLLTDWSKSLFDGAVAPEVNGFINDDCIPAWDTWIAIVSVQDSYGPCCLLSWIPSWLSHFMERGILADAAESLSWLSVDESGQFKPMGWGKRWLK